ncbi:hypothetical protein PMAYCL1PPCAC_04081, partial [Pristionchus mayeri]
MRPLPANRRKYLAEHVRLRDSSIDVGNDYLVRVLAEVDVACAPRRSFISFFSHLEYFFPDSMFCSSTGTALKLLLSGARACSFPFAPPPATSFLSDVLLAAAEARHCHQNHHHERDLDLSVSVSISLFCSSIVFGNWPQLHSATQLSCCSTCATSILSTSVSVSALSARSKEWLIVDEGAERDEEEEEE